MAGSLSEPSGEEVVVDASAIVALLLGGDLGAAVASRVASATLHAPAHLAAEVVSALGRLHLAGHLSSDDVTVRLEVLGAAPLVHHELAPLLLGAWQRRQQLRIADALYVELAAVLELPLLTTDGRLGRAGGAEVIVV